MGHHIRVWTQNELSGGTGVGYWNRFFLISDLNFISSFILEGIRLSNKCSRHTNFTYFKNWMERTLFSAETKISKMTKIYFTIEKEEVDRQRDRCPDSVDFRSLVSTIESIRSGCLTPMPFNHYTTHNNLGERYCRGKAYLMIFGCESFFNNCISLIMISLSFSVCFETSFATFTATVCPLELW